MIRSMVTSEQKDYVDRGVQTESVRHLSRPDSPASKPVNPRSYDSPAPTTLISSISPSSPRFDTAHTHSSPPADQPRATGPTRSPHSRKHPQLPYSRPSHLNGTTQRVLSLPETSPSYRVVVPRETRGASLSERPRVSISFSDKTAESSAETSFLSDNRSGSSRPRRSFTSSDMPHTPSPPSSPESVMIIGNDMRVPISFLRQKAKVEQVYEDGGWISWADSPPKPIPALHGPLSLPYARCPSGAEGTIVEGEDLSRMIWGLGLEDKDKDTTTQPAHSRKNSVHTSRKTTPQSNSLGLQAPRHSVSHNRSQSQMPHDHLRSLPVDNASPDAKNSVPLHRRGVESLVPHHSSRAQTLESPLNVLQHPDSWADACRARNDYSESFRDQLCTYDGQRGLGLDWQETLRHQNVPTDTAATTRSPNPLKPSAPVFVPANQQTARYPRIFVEPRVSHTINPSQRLTAFEIAQQYRAKQCVQDCLPTPPASSSPQWTPCMPQYTDPFPPLDIHNLVPVKHQSSFDLPQSLPRELHQSPRDASQELRRFVFDRIRNPNVQMTYDFIDDSTTWRQNQPVTPHMLSSACQYRKGLPDMSPPHPGPPPNSPLPPIPSNRVHNFHGAPPSPTSPDIRVHGHHTTKQPRSVPFARLLQRRLSSVPEEDSGRYMEACSPPPSPPKPSSTATRPLRVPSSSQADAFQSRSSHSRSSSASQYHGATASPYLRSSFASQTMQAGGDDDRARWLMPSASVGRGKTGVKLPLKTANSGMPENRSESSFKTEGSAGENLWEKENGKPRKKGRGKKVKGGNADRTDYGMETSADNVSPWLAASLGAEAWL